MKGLYVYGALLMGMCFTVGALQGNAALISLAVMSAALAALSEAAQEVARAIYPDEHPLLPPLINVTALGSWFSTAVAAVTALIVLI